MTDMSDAHGGLGELIAVLYLAIAIGSIIMARRGGLPAWVTGTAHALLTVQVILGIILFIRFPDIMPWSHVIFGLLTIPAIGLAVPLRKRLGRARGVAASAAIIFVLSTIAVVIAMTR